MWSGGMFVSWSRNDGTFSLYLAATSRSLSIRRITLSWAQIVSDLFTRYQKQSSLETEHANKGAIESRY